jgi:hypothetical protein
MCTGSSSGGQVKKAEIVPSRAQFERELQELVDTPDMAPAENQRRFVSCARVGISSCECVRG